MSTRSRALASASVLVVAGVLGTAMAIGVSSVPRLPDRPVTAAESFAPLPPTPMPTQVASATPFPTPTPVPRGADPLLGTDGRLTVLLLGSDYRPAHPGNRTDAIMVVSVDPTTGKSAGFSVPRDVADFPMPGSGVYAGKVNGLYAALERRGDGGALMKQAVSRAFGLEVDAYVFIGFSGVKQLVAAVGGVDVTLDKPYYDPYYWVNPRHRGWGLPKGKSHLNAQNALIFARSRKGDSDFGRARRQQMLVLAAVEKAKRWGPSIVPKLVAIARDSVRTDLPLGRALDVYKTLSTINLGKVDRAVFGPKTFARKGPGTDYYLNLEACRGWIANHFPPLRRVAPPSTPTPTP
jgi:LCP family protein required for cell wall assembly